ncbi:uncharacterized protein LOC144551804 [Carex rostrata]
MAGNGGETYDIISLLSGNERDYLVRNNGDKVKIEDLKDKTLGFYFSASWCPPCRKFTPKLTETYHDLLSQSKPLEVIFISRDQDEESFTSYFSKMPWLAIPFSDSEAREKLAKTFKVMGIPTLAMIDANGNFLTDDAVEFVTEYGSGAYPFTAERFAELNEIIEAQKRNQTIRSILVSGDRDYVVSGRGDKIPVSELEGKYVGLYFAVSDYSACEEFTPILSQMYEKLKQHGESFEIVTILLDKDESTYNETIAKLPFLAIPFGEKCIEKLPRYFELRSIPTLVMIGTDGKTLKDNCADIIEEHGVEALEGFPFSQDKIAILEEKARVKLEQQTLESLLVKGEFDYVVGKDGTKIPVSDLVGKNIIFYFSAKWCGPCRAFLPKLIEEYNKIKSKYSDAFEIVFVSSDRDQDSYDNFYSSMPWLALPLEDPRKSFLKKIFKIRGIPSLVAIGPSGKTVSKDVKMLLTLHGANAYPFTEERIKELEDEIENMAKGWPEKIKHELHVEHELVLTKRRSYCCDGCEGLGASWSYWCSECDFDLHPACALKKANGEENNGHEAAKEGYVCDGDVCHKVECLLRNKNMREREKAGNGGKTYDIISLLSGNERDYLVRNNGHQVKIEDLKEQTLGLYFSASWCPPCRGFTPKLTEMYHDLLSQSKPLEVIFISRDKDEESFTSYFSKMPWLAVPFSDSEVRQKLEKTFKIMGIPTLAIIDANGNFLTDDAFEFVTEHGSYAYPFTVEKLSELNEIIEARKRNQTIQSILVSEERDYVVSGRGDKIPVSELEGKYVGLYFAGSGDSACEEFTPILSQLHEKLKQHGESFEIVTILLDRDKSSYNETIAKLPFLGIPFEEKSIEKLSWYFELSSIPTLVMIGTDGKTLKVNCADIIEEHGVEAWEGFPFSQDKMAILGEKARVKLEQQTLESLLVKGEFDYVVGNDGTEIPVSDLEGKTIILYFSAKWCRPCHAFLPKLIEEYNKIKSKYFDAFEIVFVSSDRDQDSYDNFYSSMPWLAIPLEDPRKSFLKKTFKSSGISSLIAIGPSGKIVSKDVKMLLALHGADAYPFTKERIKELKDEIENMAKGWPEKIKHELHVEHELVLTKCESFICDGCEEMGGGWSYWCNKCEFDLHPACALKKPNGEENNGHEAAKEGYVCDGDVCRKV